MGYQPTLATDMGLLQERITSTGHGSITSVQVHLTRFRPLRTDLSPLMMIHPLPSVSRLTLPAVRFNL